jgi:hypothetical protein
MINSSEKEDYLNQIKFLEGLLKDDGYYYAYIDDDIGVKGTIDIDHFIHRTKTMYRDKNSGFYYNDDSVLRLNVGRKEIDKILLEEINCSILQLKNEKSNEPIFRMYTGMRILYLLKDKEKKLCTTLTKVRSLLHRLRIQKSLVVVIKKSSVQ